MVRRGSLLSSYLIHIFGYGVLRKMPQINMCQRLSSHETRARKFVNYYPTAPGVVLTGKESFEEDGRDVALLEVGVVEDTFVQRNGRFDAFDHELVEGSTHARNGFLPVSPMGNDLGDHGIIERGDHHVRFHCRVDSYPETARGAVFGDHAGTGCKLLRVFGIDATFEAVPDEFDVLLFERERLPVREANLLLDEIDAGHHFGDRVLHLDTGVHFHEEIGRASCRERV